MDAMTTTSSAKNELVTTTSPERTSMRKSLLATVDAWVSQRERADSVPAWDAFTGAMLDGSAGTCHVQSGTEQRVEWRRGSHPREVALSAHKMASRSY
jgi:hypothetical protein